MVLSQDAYYCEGVKLPLIVTFFKRSPISTEYHILGFREHIFTHTQSAIGRY